jgi:hypothetical protein
LLSPELAAGIGRVKGAKRVGVRLGNWLSADEVKQLLRSPDLDVLKGKRDRAIIAVLAGCGLRRAEVARLSVSDIQKRDERWVIVDLYGKGGHIRTVPVPEWVKTAIDCWTTAAPVTSGRIFRCVSKTDSVWGEGVSEKVIWCVVKEFASKAHLGHLRLTICDVHVPVCAMLREENWSRFNSFSDTSACRRPKSTSGANRNCASRSMTTSASNRRADQQPRSGRV